MAGDGSWQAAHAAGCDSPAHRRATVTQYKPVDRRAWARLRWGLPAATLLVLLLPLLPLTVRAACPGPPLKLLPLGPGVWQVPGWPGEADARNRGWVSNLLLVRQSPAGPDRLDAPDMPDTPDTPDTPDGADKPDRPRRPPGPHPAPRLWALGSGPSPAWGAALACQVRQRLGLRLSDVVSPWARPELVLGVAGIAGVRHWAHASVADAMAEQCPHCVDRLRQRLGAARADLGDGPGADPIRLPGHRLQGEQGLLGPFAWWRLPRADGRWTTVWRLRRQPLWAAQGLLNQGAPPDGRDADLALLQQSSLALAALARPDGSAARFVGEQGRPMDSSAPARHAAYWQALQATAAAAIERGDDEAAAAPPLPGWPADWARHPWHGFNWQRAWRQLEPGLLAAPPR